MFVLPTVVFPFKYAKLCNRLVRSTPPKMPEFEVNSWDRAGIQGKFPSIAEFVLEIYESGQPDSDSIEERLIMPAKRHYDGSQ